jgi:hypothetical protein
MKHIKNKTYKEEKRIMKKCKKTKHIMTKRITTKGMKRLNIMTKRVKRQNVYRQKIQRDKMCNDKQYKKTSDIKRQNVCFYLTHNKTIPTYTVYVETSSSFVGESHSYTVYTEKSATQQLAHKPSHFEASYWKYSTISTDLRVF